MTQPSRRLMRRLGGGTVAVAVARRAPCTLRAVHGTSQRAATQLSDSADSKARQTEASATDPPDF